MIGGMNMIVQKSQNKYGLCNVSLCDGRKSLDMSESNNGELFWTYYNFDHQNDDQTIHITKENEDLYAMFDHLYQVISTGEIFKPTSLDWNHCKTCEERKKLLAKMKEWNHLLMNEPSYQDMYQEGVIRWHDDIHPIPNPNKIAIEKIPDEYLIHFQLNDSQTVRIYHPESKRRPFNDLFLHLYHELQNYDLQFHQMHIDEYEYQLKKVRK